MTNLCLNPGIVWDSFIHIGSCIPTTGSSKGAGGSWYFRCKRSVSEVNYRWLWWDPVFSPGTVCKSTSGSHCQRWDHSTNFSILLFRNLWWPQLKMDGNTLSNWNTCGNLTFTQLLILRSQIWKTPLLSDSSASAVTAQQLKWTHSWFVTKSSLNFLNDLFHIHHMPPFKALTVTELNLNPRLTYWLVQEKDGGWTQARQEMSVLITNS